MGEAVYAHRCAHGGRLGLISLCSVCWCSRHLFVSFVKYLLFKSVSRKYALNFAGSHPQFFVNYTPAWFSHLMLLINLYLVTNLPFLFWFSFLFYPFHFAPLVCTPTYSSVSLSVTHQARYQFSDSPNFSGVDFVPHATSFSVQMDSPFLPKLTSRLHMRHPNSSSPSDFLVPNIGCPGPLILFICPFVLRW
jgi:hypothetical protein